jgi:hypothetical protein
LDEGIEYQTTNKHVSVNGNKWLGYCLWE